MPTLVNGIASEQLAVQDRGLHYGDGLFETLAIVDGAALRWALHLARLQEGCRRLGIRCPDPALLEREVAMLAAGVARGVIKLVVTRGVGGRGYRPPTDAQPTRILSLHPWPDYPAEAAQEGIALRTCSTTLGTQPLLAGIKHLNRLEQVLARREWDDPAVFEGVMCDGAGRVIEGTLSNLFLVRGGVLHTPDLSRCGVAGVMRGAVLAAASELGLAVRVGDLDLAQARASEELFITNTLVGVWPVRRWDDTTYQAPGPLTQTVMNYFKKTQ